MKNKIYKMDNGITVMVVPLTGLKSVTVEVFLKIGSKYESRDEFGMSHFLEHMAFKGTKTRKTASEINKEIDSKGAGYNAGTGHEMTSYYITTIKENTLWAIELLSDMLINSVFSSGEIEKEKGVIIEEIKMYNDNPLYGLSSELINFLYGESKSGCWNIAGKVSDIEKINRNRVVGFRNKYLNTKEMVVVLAGNVDPGVFNEVNRFFGGFINPKENGLPKVEVVLNKGRIKEINKEVEQGHFAMGLPAINRGDQRKYAFKLLDIILSGNSSSRLYQKIREEKALAYYIHSISEVFEETGFFGVQSGVRAENMYEAIDLVEKEFEEIKDNLKEEELSRAKDYIIGKTNLMMDRSSYWTSYYGQKILLENKNGTIQDELEKLKSVKLSQLKELANDIFIKEELRVVLIKNK